MILSEIPLSPSFAFGKFELFPLLRKQIDPFRPYALVLRMPSNFDFLNTPLVGEAVAALLSFCMRRRMKAHRRPFSQRIYSESELGPEVFTSLPFVSVGPEMLLQQPLVANELKNRIARFKTLYAIIVRMNKEDYLATVRSIHLYQLALLTLRDDVGLAYALLVASAETMA